MPLRFALLHATYHRAGGPLEVREAWLSRADLPERVEHIFAMDADDVDSVASTEGMTRVVGEPTGGVTSVRNWNAAAAISTADLLVVVADDLFPPQGWDTALAQVVAPLDPTTDAFAIKLTDDPSFGDRLLRHPVVSRAFYERHGLFSPKFDGVYCDNDITRRAFWRSVILDGRSVVLDHRHPTLEDGHQRSMSHGRINAGDEYVRGESTYNSLWSWRHRASAVRLVPPAVSRRGHLAVMLCRQTLLVLARAEFTARAARRVVRRVTGRD